MQADDDGMDEAASSRISRGENVASYDYELGSDFEDEDLDSDDDEVNRYDVATMPHTELPRHADRWCGGSIQT